MAVSVDEVSSSLVREYLSRKGFRRTIACMDEEHPRTEASINNRSLLRQILNMEDLYKKNKVQKSPLKTLLEILVKHHIQDKDITSNGDSHLLQSPPTLSTTVHFPARMNEVVAGDGSKSSLISKQVQSRSSAGELCPSSENQKSQPLPASLQDNNSSIRREPAKTTSITGSTQRNRTNRIRRGIMAGPITSTLQESINKRLHQRHEVPQPLLTKREESRPAKDGLLVTASNQNQSETSLMDFSSAKSVGGHRELWSAPGKVQGEDCFEKVGHDITKTKKVKPLTKPNMADLDVSEMVLDDVDEDNAYLQDFSKVALQSSVVDLSPTGRPMDQRTAVEIKDVLLGSSLNCFSLEWRNQGFTFSETHDLRYGIVQEKGGPCGVLATVQAFVLKKLMFENIISGDAVLQRLRPSNTTRRKCLVLAIAEILWRAGEEKQTTVAINSGTSHFTPAGRYKSEGVFEKIKCFTLDDLKDLQLFLEQHIEQFETGGLGCILLTVSAVLSRTIQKVREDMDVPNTTLIGAHGYCTQELVNLLLSGRAISNVFDNDMELDSGNGNITLLKGMKGSCDIGLLSLFEHYNICKVGTYLKTPRYPIWVVCSESHFSVLFGLQRELLTNQDESLEFDLYYYDGLANQEEEIRLTVAVGRSAPSHQDIDTDLIPPLEHCIQTRWKDAFVSWNDTEPIL